MFRTGKLMGTIRIDGVATSEIPLKTLRSSMSVIPQVRGAITMLHSQKSFFFESVKTHDIRVHISTALFLYTLFVYRLSHAIFSWILGPCTLQWNTENEY